MTFRPIVSPSLIPLLLLAPFLLLAGNRPAHADYYKYTDKKGAICISNSLDAVPPQYRATMKVIRDETLEKKDKATRSETPRPDTLKPGTTAPAEATQETTPAAPVPAANRLTARFPWLAPLLFIGVAIVLFFIVRKIAGLLPSPLLAKVVYLAFFLGVMVFAFKNYADHVGNSYFNVKARILSLFEKANRREAPEQGERAPAHPGKD
jgi:hypothetical protein